MNTKIMIATATVLVLCSCQGQIQSDLKHSKIFISSSNIKTAANAAIRQSSTIKTNTFAVGYGAAQAIDGNGDSSWIASLSPTVTNNSAWLVLDLGSTQKVDALHWNSPKFPYPVSAPSHYIVEVSTDEVHWQPVHQYNGAPVFNGTVLIGRYARYLKLRTLKVNDGTGWSLGFNEIWAESSPETNECDKIIGPEDDYLAILNTLGKHPGSKAYTVCLNPGVYQGPIIIKDAENILIRSLKGGVRLEATISIPNLGIAPVPEIDQKSAPLNIINSTDVTVDGLEIKNNHVFVSTEDQKFEISRAVSLLNNVRTTLSNCSIKSSGKQAVHYQLGNTYRIVNNHIEAYYFSIDARETDAYLSHNTLVTRDARLNDAHSVVFVYHSNLNFEDTNFINYSGRGIFTGAQFPENTLTIRGLTTSFGLEHWAQMHPNYQNLKVELLGTFPTLIPFWYNPFSGGGLSMGNQICFKGGTGNDYCEYK